MKKQYKLGVIGGGFMARAILQGAVRSEFIKAKKVIVADPSQSALAQLEELGVECTRDNRVVAANCEYLLIAVKPQTFAAVAEDLHEVSVDKIITIMAGDRKEKIRAALPWALPKIARAMPNLPCSVGAGMTALDLSDFDGEIDDCAFVHSIFDNVGNVLEVPEEKLNAVTGISGSGPAYVYMFIEALADGAVKCGLSRKDAYEMVAQTVLGSAKMVLETGKHPGELKDMVCSPGGTTIAAVEALEQWGFRNAIMKATDACYDRCRSL